MTNLKPFTKQGFNILWQDRCIGNIKDRRALEDGTKISLEDLDVHLKYNLKLDLSRGRALVWNINPKSFFIHEDGVLDKELVPNESTDWVYKEETKKILLRSSSYRDEDYGIVSDSDWQDVTTKWRERIVYSYRIVKIGTILATDGKTFNGEVPYYSLYCDTDFQKEVLDEVKSKIY